MRCFQVLESKHLPCRWSDMNIISMIGDNKFIILDRIEYFMHIVIGIWEPEFRPYRSVMDYRDTKSLEDIAKAWKENYEDGSLSHLYQRDRIFSVEVQRLLRDIPRKSSRPTK